MLTENFFNYLKKKEIILKDVTLKQVTKKLEEYSNDLSFISAYINYDVDEKLIDAGAHPATLQALAEIKHVELHIWQLGNNKELIPHKQTEYASYTPSTVEQRRDILFVNGNHFDRLELTPEENNVFFKDKNY